MKPEYFVGIEDHTLVRKNILQSTKGTIKVLQRLELIKKKRELKIKKITELKKLVLEINYMIENLLKIIPKSEINKINIISKKQALQMAEDSEEKPARRRPAKKVTRKTTKKVVEKPEQPKKIIKKTIRKSKQDINQMTIKESSANDLKTLQNELQDIESKLKELNN